MIKRILSLMALLTLPLQAQTPVSSNFLFGTNIGHAEKVVFILPDSIPGVSENDGLEPLRRQIQSAFPDAPVYYFLGDWAWHYTDASGQTAKQKGVLLNHFTSLSDAMTTAMDEHPNTTTMFVLQPWMSQAAMEAPGGQIARGYHLVNSPGGYDPALATGVIDRMKSGNIKFYLTVLSAGQSYATGLSHPGWVEYAQQSAGYTQLQLTKTENPLKSVYLPSENQKAAASQ